MSTLGAKNAQRSGRPAMSVVLATPDTFETIKPTLSHLQKQTVCERLELVIVCPHRQTLDPDESCLTGFFGYKIVEISSFDSIGQANAAGVQAASAEVVALAEDHCFPEPEWAEHLLAAHAGPYSVVGPAVKNANPGTAVSWADLFIGYGLWLWPTHAREVDLLPGHNSSYKRSVLLEYDDQLVPMLNAETVLHWDLHAKGHRLYLEPQARVAHTNFALWRSWIPIQFYNGWLFAGQRAIGMPWWKRAMFVAGSPLIPFVRLVRIARPVGRALIPRLILTFPALMFGLMLDGLGQFVGYVAGTRGAVKHVARFEFHRSRHVTAKDRAQLFGFVGNQMA